MPGISRSIIASRCWGLLRSGSLSRAELARRTGLTRAAISVIAEELLADGLVEERPRGASLPPKGAVPRLSY